ncbi:MAG: Eco57I restriction-modification methylase domain-containing protein, partial [Nannocystaceae bacterium]
PIQRGQSNRGWSDLLQLFRDVHTEATGNSLFEPGSPGKGPVYAAVALFEQPADPPDDNTTLELLRLLQAAEGLAPLDLCALPNEALGTIYEHLLDYELRLAGDEPVAVLSPETGLTLPLDRLEAMSDTEVVSLVGQLGVAKPTKPNARTTAEERVESIVHVRARAWAYRAARLAGYLPGGSDPSAEFCQQIASRLLPAVHPPGSLYLVRSPTARKGAGAFYTPPQLTRPTVERTLEPRIGTASHRPPPEVLFNLTVCDPAMGCANFLLATHRILSEAALESLYQHQCIHTTDGQLAVTCPALGADNGPRQFSSDQELKAAIRRKVAENCIYGVDQNPIAVELARVAIWLEVCDASMPLGTLANHLRCGDALVGCTHTDVGSYPLLALRRRSPDHKWVGVHHKGSPWHLARKNQLRRAIQDQISLLETPGEPDLATPLQARRQAYDTWCALWFWPADKLDKIPLPSNLHHPSSEALAIVHEVSRRCRFFHWELEFPEVFPNDQHGFDAIVGNPPWEIQKPNSHEFFSRLDPLYRSYSKQKALSVQKSLFASNPAIETQWLKYMGRLHNLANFVRHAAEPFGDAKAADHDGGHLSLGAGKQSQARHQRWRLQRPPVSARRRFLYQGSADLNSYKLFLELAYTLVRADQGQLGLIVPSGIYTDRGTTRLRKLLLQNSRWRWLYGFENRKRLFAIDSRLKFCVVIAEKGGSTQTIQAAFMRHHPEDWPHKRGVFTYPAHQVSALSPTHHSILEIRGPSDVDAVTRIYANSVLLGDNSPQGWGVEYAREFDMTNDSHRFVARVEAEAKGFEGTSEGSWVDKRGEVWLPLVQGAMLHQHNPFYQHWQAASLSKGAWVAAPSDPPHRWLPKYLIRQSDYNQSNRAIHGQKIGIRDIARSTDERTTIASPIPDLPCGNIVGVLRSTRVPSICLAAVMGTFAFDFCARLRISGTHLNYYLLKELPLPRWRPTPGVQELATRLSCTHTRFAPWWKPGPQPWRKLWAVTPHERLRLRSMLDAIVAFKFGLDRALLAWILKDCDYPVAELTDPAFCRRLDPKGFW